MPESLSKAQRALVDAYRQGLGPRACERLTEAQLCRDAMMVAARVEAEIERLQRAGGLKSVNRAYRRYRLEASSRGEAVMRYADWMLRYKADLMRDIAATLR